MGEQDTFYISETVKPPENPQITFSNPQNESIGTLYYEDGLMKFKGNVHESAKVLFEYVCHLWNDKYTEK